MSILSVLKAIHLLTPFLITVTLVTLCLKNTGGPLFENACNTMKAKLIRSHWSNTEPQTTNYFNFVKLKLAWF